MSTLPRAVLKADAEADEAIAQDSPNFDASRIGTEDDSGDIQIIDEPRTVVQQTVSRQGQAEQPSLLPNNDARTANSDTARTEMSTDEKIAALTKDLEIEKHKFSSLLGRLESQQKPISEENRTLRKKVQELEQEIANLRTDDGTDVQNLRKKLPVDMPYDDNELKLIMTAARQVARDEIGSAMPKAQQALRDEITEGTRQSSMSRFVTELGAKYPGLLEMDAAKDPSWMAFLSTVVRGTGGRMTYGRAAQEAINEMDLAGMSDIVEEFKNQSGVTFGDKASDGKVSSQVRPRQTSASSQRSAQVNKPYFTVAQVKQFNKDMNSGAIHRTLNPEQIASLQQDIEDAEEEGRILQG